MPRAELIKRRLLLVCCVLALGAWTVDTASASSSASASKSHRPRAARTKRATVDSRSAAALAQSYLVAEMGYLLGHRQTVTRGSVMAPLFIGSSRAGA